ncbi:MAG: AhpC/TSA family protein [Prevotella sp.]|nr:AhpC/TSA family protein [Prevotella sp.]
MKKNIYLLLISFFMMPCMKIMAQNVHITGKINNYQGGTVTLLRMTDQGKQEDAVTVDTVHRFNIQLAIAEPTRAYLSFEEPHTAIEMFIEPGMTSDMQISFVEKTDEGQKVLVPDVVFTGDNSDAFRFMQGMDFMAMYKDWPWERLSATPFSSYRAEVVKTYEELFARLYTIKSASFRKMMTDHLQGMQYSETCRWAWAEHKEKDKDFARWILSFDHNDPANMDKIDNYWRWYSDKNMPPRGERTASSYYDCLRSAFTNQDIINDFADDMIQQVLKDAPEDMDEQMAAYKACSTNPEGHAVADKLYAHYSKLKKGAPAADFDFYDKSGKKYTLKDFRGKALYIDCWATWCGPCCEEIPHMEKLYNHYKKNKKIELISISLDDNKSKWEKKIAADKPGWRQFIVNDNFKSLLCKNYDIDGIPRFLMFDKKGNIISLDAPRPSDERIVEWIDNMLK